MHTTDDADLENIARVLAGETEAYGRLVDKYGETIARQMRAFSPMPQVIEELTHDVFVEAYIGLANYRQDAPFRHWLARIATITGYRHWKTKERRSREVPFEEDRDGGAFEEKGEPGDPDAAGEVLHAMLAELPDADRLILSMMYIENCKQNEIAARLGCTKTAAAVRIFRAKKRLRKLGRDEKWRKRVKWMIS